MGIYPNGDIQHETAQSAATVEYIPNECPDMTIKLSYGDTPVMLKF